MLMTRTMSVFGIKDVRDSGGGVGVAVTLLSTQQSDSSVTSTDRNRRTCGAGCVVLIQLV